MTAQQLHDLTKALFAKHPSAKPEGLYPPIEADADWWIDNDKGSPGVPVFTSTAELIIIGHLAKWLAECYDKEGIEVVPNCGHSGDKWVLWSRFENELLGGGPTLLHALVAACMEVEE